MGRVIKFRAWDIRRGKMIGSDYPQNWDDNKDEWWADVALMNLVGIEQIAKDENYRVMQFTGCQDKNGIDVYEGDIVRYAKHDNTFGDSVEFVISVVEFEDDKAFFPLPNTSILLGSLDGAVWFSGYEVIGNIHETPELLTITPTTRPQSA